MSVDDSYDFKIIATPDTLVDSTQSVTLKVNGSESLTSKGFIFEWTCSKYNNDLTFMKMNVQQMSLSRQWD